MVKTNNNDSDNNRKINRLNNNINVSSSSSSSSSVAMRSRGNDHNRSENKNRTNNQNNNNYSQNHNNNEISQDFNMFEYINNSSILKEDEDNDNKKQNDITQTTSSNTNNGTTTNNQLFLEDILKFEASISLYFLRKKKNKSTINELLSATTGQQQEQHVLLQKLIYLTGCTLYNIYKKNYNNKNDDNITFYIQRVQDWNNNSDNKTKKKMTRLEYIRNQYTMKNKPKDDTNNLPQSINKNEGEILLEEYFNRKQDSNNHTKINNKRNYDDDISKNEKVENDDDASKMTLLERIRARDKKNSFIKEKDKNNTIGNNNTNNKNVSINLLRIADSIRSCSRRMCFNSLPSKNEVYLSVPFTQIYPYLSGTARPNLSRKEVRKALHELSSKVPDWLTFRHATDQPKKMLLRIKQSIDYNKIRVSLGARNIKRPIISNVDNKKSQPRYVVKSSSSSSSSLYNTATFSKVQDLERASPIQKSKIGLFTTITTPILKNKKVMSASSSIPIPSFKEDCSIQKQNKQKSKTPIGLSKKRKATTTDGRDWISSTTTTSSSTATTTTPATTPLRINNHLLHPDDDDTTIHYWEDSSPRGLKKLFKQLNSGDRI